MAGLDVKNQSHTCNTDRYTFFITYVCIYSPTYHTYVYMYIYIYTCIYIYTHTYIYIYMYTYTYIYIYNICPCYIANRCLGILQNGDVSALPWVQDADAAAALLLRDGADPTQMEAEACRAWGGSTNELGNGPLMDDLPEVS